MVKIERTHPEPPELAEERNKTKGEYNLPSVREQLKKDFYRKCYICGGSVRHGYNIEHLRPHHDGARKDLMLAWDNLFLSCPNCNSIKNQKSYETHIIDCCETDPEKMIRQEIYRGKVAVSVLENSPSRVDAERTAKLIEECFNCTTETQRAEICTQKRRELKALAISLCKKLRRYRDLRDSAENCNEAACTKAKNEVLDMIDIRSEYAAFLRTFVRDRLEMFPEFESIVGANPQKERGHNE